MHVLQGKAYPAFLAALSAEPTTAVRLHPTKGKGLFQDGLQIPWSVGGRFLSSRPSFTLDPHLHAGAYYVQDASSQFVEALFRKAETLGAFAQDSAPMVLDVCAAPGGKTTHLASLVPDGVIVVANEVVQHRARILEENVHKWGMPNVLVTSSDPKELGKMPLRFDMLLVDAPCSGEGLFRKDPKATTEWSPAHVAHCALRDRRIIADVWPLLREGGFLIFSTCTWNETENEGVVRWIEEEFGAVRVSVPGAFDARDEVYRFFPQHQAGEGFTCVLLQKTSPSPLQTKKPSWKPCIEGRELLKEFVEPGNVLIPMMVGNLLTALSEPMAAVLSVLQRAQIRVLTAGVPLGEMHGVKKEFALHPMLAHSTLFRGESLPACSLDLELAREYLRRKDVPYVGQDGRTVVTFEGNRLGFARAKNGRLASQYPMKYRIVRL